MPRLSLPEPWNNLGCALPRRKSTLQDLWLAPAETCGWVKSAEILKGSLWGLQLLQGRDSKDHQHNQSLNWGSVLSHSNCLKRNTSPRAALKAFIGAFKRKKNHRKTTSLLEVAGAIEASRTFNRSQDHKIIWGIFDSEFLEQGWVLSHGTGLFMVGVVKGGGGQL